MNLKLLTRLKTRDAAVVYEYLFERLNRSAGTIEATSYEKIAATLTADGIQTARSANFTSRVVREKLNELESLGVVERVATTPSTFDLFVFMPYPNPVESSETNSEVRVDHYGGKSLFDYQSADGTEETASRALDENGNGNGNGKAKKRVASKEEYIYINKQINKPSDLEIGIEESDATSVRELDQDDRPRTDDLRERIDFDRPKVDRFRREIAKRAWEPSINPDLIDRVVGIAVLKIGGLSYKDCYRMIDEAQASRDLWKRTDGRAGREKLWETLAFQVKRVYETNGWRWTPTRIGSEPRPEYKIETGILRELATVE